MVFHLCPLWALLRGKGHMSILTFLGTLLHVGWVLILLTDRERGEGVVCVVLIDLASSLFSLCWREENWDLAYVTVSLFCSHTWLIVWVGLGSNSFSSHYQCYWWEIWYQADSYTFVGNHFSSLKLLQCLGVCVCVCFLHSSCGILVCPFDLKICFLQLLKILHVISLMMFSPMFLFFLSRPPLSQRLILSASFFSLFLYCTR